MYLPATNEQMFDILADLRLYAAMNGMPNLAEQLDDAMVVLRHESVRCQEPRLPALQDTL